MTFRSRRRRSVDSVLDLSLVAGHEVGSCPPCRTVFDLASPVNGGENSQHI